MGRAGRTMRHLFMTEWQVNRAFPASTLAAIERAVGEAEQSHGGQVRVVVEAALPTESLFKNQSARERAIDVFSLSRVWDTEHNNGVLLYLLLADRDVEIVADRGIAGRVPQTEWEAICRQMEQAFSAGNFKAGIGAGIHAIAAKLAAHFPKTQRGQNELPDKPLLL